MARRAGDRAAQLLALILAAIGIGSYLFHTHAQVWAMLADVVPIQVFILVYLGARHRPASSRVPWWAGVLAAPPSFRQRPGYRARLGAVFGPLNGSVGYMPVPILILVYAAPARAARPRRPAGWRSAPACSPSRSSSGRSTQAVCGAFPIGTHFLWHLLNGVDARLDDFRADPPSCRRNGSLIPMHMRCA